MSIKEWIVNENEMFNPKTNKEFALYYNSMKWNVFPLQEKSKFPAISWKSQYGLDTRLLSIEEIEDFWGENENYGIGLLLGEYSKNICVIDVDSKEAYEYVEKMGLPETSYVETSKEYKRHYYFQVKHPEKLRSLDLRGSKDGKTLDIDLELEVKWTGTYVVIPPSIHPTGIQYKWKKDKKFPTFPDLPEWIYKLCEKVNEEEEKRKEQAKEKRQQRVAEIDTESEKVKEEIRNALSPMEYLEMEGVSFSKKGSRYIACCPFHQETKPSLCYTPTEEHKDYVKCFGCGIRYDLFECIKHLHNLWDNRDFPKVMKIASEKADIELPEYRSKEEVEEKKTEKEEVVEEEKEVEVKFPTKQYEKQVIEEYNKRFGAISINGEFYILEDKGLQGMVLYRKTAFKDTFQTDYVEYKNDRGDTKYKAKHSIWLKSPLRKQYKGIIFSPTGDKEGYYNLWKGLAVEAKEGTWDKYRQHIWKNIANENEEVYEYILNWIAYMFQNIGKQKAGIALVLRGLKGTGKGIFASQIKRIFGIHGIHLQGGNSLTSRFNGHLQNKCFIFADEAIWAGDKKAEGYLKGLITEDNIVIEQKHKDAFEIDNHMYFIFASNDDWVIPASFDERRFCVLDISDKHRRDREYFGSIVEEMNNGGREAFLYDMLKRDISGIDITEYPSTLALQEQVFHSSTGTIEGFIMDYLSNDEEYSCLISKSSFYNRYREYMERNGRKKGIEGMRIFGKKVNSMLKPVERKKNVDGMKEVRHYEFGSIDEARETFEKYTEHKVEWGE